VYTIGYDFCDTFVQLDELSFAVRLATLENVYAPDPARSEIQTSENGVRLRAGGLIWAGGQQRAEGSLEFEITRGADGRYVVTASASHETQMAKSMVLLVRGIEVAALTRARGERAALEETAWGKRWITARRYPQRGAVMPLVFLEDSRGDQWFALSKDTHLRAKYFASYFDYLMNQQILALSHEEDVRARANHIELPAWHIGRMIDPQAVVLERCHDLEKNFGLVPYARRRDVPAWLDDIQLVLYLHGEHWTGHVFNTFDQMSKILHWVAERIDGKRVMAFLPAWDGRYYYNYPLYEPSERLGGSTGLERLVEQAHQLGIKVVPMLGANGANAAFVEKLGLRDAVLRDAWGKEKRLDWVDWDYDLTTENNGFLLNLGHPGFRNYLIERASRLVTEFGADGIFLDITYYWENDPQYSPYEGTIAWAEEMRRRHPNLLLFGENSYDALWGIFPIFAEDQGPVGLEAALHRYARQTYYLAHPSPVAGSGGIHEGAWHYQGWKWNVPEMTIPALSIVEDTITTHARETEAEIARAKEWKFRAPPIANRA
jgi:hypothetical protein